MIDYREILRLDSLGYSRRRISSMVNSSHHQAIDEVGRDLKVELWAEDVPEGFVHQSLPIVGVQWHPERMMPPYRTGEMADGGLLFKRFFDMVESYNKKEKKRS